MTDIAIVSIAIAAVGVSWLFYFAFLRWVDAKYPKAQHVPTNDGELFNSARLTALEERVSTLELQRAILRKVPDRGG